MNDPLFRLRKTYYRTIWMLLAISLVPTVFSDFLIPGLVFNFLQWNTIWIFIIQLVLALIYFNSERDVSVPAVGAILLLVGLIDTYHLLVELGAIGSVPLNHTITTYIWSICRITNALLLAFSLFILSKRSIWWEINRKTTVVLSLVALVIAAMFLVHHIVKSDIPSSLIYLDSWLKRPYDAIALVIFAVTALLTLPRVLRKRSTNLFDVAIVYSLIPMIISQLHTTLGSSVHLDTHFMAAYYTKTIAYLFPLVGLIASNISIGLTKANMFSQLVDVQEIVQAKSRELEAEIKDRKLAEKQLQQSRDFSMAVLETAAEAIIIIDELGQIEFFNKAAEDIFQYSRNEILGKNVNLLIPEPFQAKHDQYLQNFKQTGIKKIIGVSRELEGLRKDGSLIPVRLSVSFVLVEGKYRFIGIADDISRTIAYRQELIQKTKALERSNQVKDEFISTVSHELRTPLVSMLGYIDLLLEGDAGEINEDQEEFLRIVFKNTQRLDALINDLLDVQKLDTGQIEFARDEVLLSELLAESAEPFKEQAEEKGLMFTTDIAPNITIVGDKMRLSQAFANLTSNAVKYTKDGGVHLALTAEAGKATVQIKDTGIGLTPEEINRLFDRFFRADDDYVKEVGGTGLGLSITQAIINEHHGEIQVHSEKGKGSEFIINFPPDKTRAEESAVLHQQKAVPSPEPGNPNPPLLEDTCDILLADDDENFTRIFNMMISREGHSLYICQDQSQLLDTLKQGKLAYIIINSDFMNTDCIEWLEVNNPKIPVILLENNPNDLAAPDQTARLNIKARINKTLGINQIWQQIKSEL